MRRGSTSYGHLIAAMGRGSLWSLFSGTAAQKVHDVTTHSVPPVFRLKDKQASEKKESGVWGFGFF